MRVLRCALGTLALLVWPPAPGATPVEPPAGSIRRSVEVRVTNLDVVVTDRDGKRVRGLAASDFTVREDGVPRAITNFSEIGPAGSAAAKPAAEPEAPPAAPDRENSGVPTAPARPSAYLVLFVDDLHVSFANRKRVLDEVRAFLRKTAASGVPVLVLASDRSPRILQKFTTDAVLLDRAVSELERRSPAGARAEASLRATYSAIDQAMRDRRRSTAEMYARAWASEATVDLVTSLQSLETTLAQLSALDGRKVLVHVSDGLPQAPGAEAWQYLRSFGSGGRGVGPSPEGSAEDASTRFERVARAASAARVALHMVDATGLAEDGFGRSAETPIGQRGNLDPIAARANLQSMLSYLAEETGGTAVLNRSRVGAPLEEAAEDLASCYSLGYETPRADEDATHRVEVKVARPGLTARAQRSLRVRSAETRVAEAVGAALVFGRPENPLGVTVELGTPRLEKDRALLPLRVRVPANRVAPGPDAPGTRGRVVYYVQARDEEGRVSDLVRQEEEVRTDVETVHETLLRARPGRQVLSLAVRDVLSGDASFVQKTVSIPGPKK